MAPRKSLNQQAQAFLKGEIPAEPAAPVEQAPEEEDIYSKLRAKSRGEATKRITTDLPDSRFRRWKRALADLGTDGNTVVNELIEQFLKKGGYD